MRWIFLVLLITNVALFVWHWSESDRQSRIRALNASVKEDREMPGARLVLLSELTDQQRAELGKAKDNKSPAPQSSAPVVDNKAADAAPPRPTDKPVEQKAPEPKVPEQPAPAPVAADVAKPTPGRCLMLGPVTDKQQGPQLTQRLAAVGIVAEVREISVEGGLDYWVILPPAEDSKAALRKLQELQGRGIEGQMIPQGDLANAVSLGIFGQKANAEKRLEEVRSLGYAAAVIREKARVFKENWVVLGEKEAPKLSKEVWLGLHEDFPVLDKRPTACPAP